MSYLDFNFQQKTQSGKTSIWLIHSKSSGATLGGVYWNGPWRKYVFRTVADCDFDWNCLQEIIDFCKSETEKHKGQ